RVMRAVSFRDHYDLFDQLVKDRRFQQQVGHIFTEIGSTSLQPYVESFLMDDQLNEPQVVEKLSYIARHLGREVVWEKTNYYEFLRRIYFLNHSLPTNLRVHVYPSDLDFRWEHATRESWAEFESKQLATRDEGMAENVIRKFHEICSSGSERNKA